MDRWTISIVLALAVCLALAGCSGAPEEAANASPTGAATTGTSTAGSTTTSITVSSTTLMATATPTSSQTTTATPSTLSRTQTATATPSPTPTATPTPTPQPKRGPGQGTEWQVTITRVIDGDTVEARFPNGETDTLRLLGVDTPETTLSRTNPAEFESIPETQAGKDHLYEWGGKAKTFATNRLEGKTVRVAVDPEADRRGSYGRLLTYVYYDDGTNFNKQLIEEGYARLYDSPFSKRDAFAEAERRAQSNDVGLWGFDGGSTATPTPTATATPTPDEGNGDSGGATPTPPADGDYDCSHFDNQSAAQQVYEASQGDEHRLDSDGDGEACESLA